MMKAARGQELVSCPTARTRQLADLLEELIMEILLRFPTRTLVSLKSVCTSWRNLISSPDFTRNHLRRSCLRDPTLTPPRIAFYDDHGIKKIGVFSVQSMIDNCYGPIKVDYFRAQRYRIIGSYNGLLCLFDYEGCWKMHVILWNPCTGFTFESPEFSWENVCFSGFGYHHLSDSYNFYAIVVEKGTSGFEYSTRIYTFGLTSSWRRIDDNPFDSLGFPAYKVITADNMQGVFFCSSRACTINWTVNHHVVLYFDLGREIYGHFFLPDMDLDDHSRRRCTHLCVLRNCLSVCHEDRRTHEWIVWQMKKYGDAQSWTKLAVISLHPKFADSNPCSCLQPLYISESDVLLAFCPFFGIVLYNLNDGSVDFPEIDGSGMGNHPIFSQCFGYRIACIYHDSLVSPNGLSSNSFKMRFIKPKPNCLQPLYISESDVLLAFSSSLGIILYNLNDGSVNFSEIDGSSTRNHPFSQCVGYRMACIYHDCLVSSNGLQSNSSKMLLRFIKPKPKPIDS